MLYYILLLCAAQLFCATPQETEEVLLSKNGTTWYVKKNIQTIQPESYNPGLHIFITPSQEAFLFNNLVSDQGSEQEESKQNTHMVHALYKDEQGQTKEVFLSNRIVRKKASGSLNIFFHVHTPGSIIPLGWSYIKANFTITPAKPTIDLTTPTQILHYLLPYDSSKQAYSSCIRLSSSQQEPFKIEYFYNANGVWQLNKAFAFFQKNTPQEHISVTMPTQEDQEEQRGLLGITTTYLSKVWKAFTW